MRHVAEPAKDITRVVLSRQMTQSSGQESRLPNTTRDSAEVALMKLCPENVKMENAQLYY